MNTQKIYMIQEILMKYCDPKPEFDCMMAGEVARIIMDRILDLEDKEINLTLEKMYKETIHNETNNQN